eukprot:6804736-Alexandrium_andersonii.AAC.1
MVNGEHAMASARSAQVGETEQMAEQRVNAEASNALGLQRELQRVESMSEVAHVRLTEQTRQEFELVRS